MPDLTDHIILLYVYIGNFFLSFFRRMMGYVKRN
jgi:hypothetical protein